MVNNSLLSMLSWDDIHQAMLMMVYNGEWWILWWLMMDFMMVNNSLLSMLSWDDIHQAMLMMVYNG